jgi:hypothetical protein
MIDKGSRRGQSLKFDATYEGPYEITRIEGLASYFSKI